MKLERNFVGQINLTAGVVDITDPCYDGGTWCRMNNVRIKPGIYNCYSYIGESKGWGKRVWINQIVIAHSDYTPSEDFDAEETEAKIKSGRSWRRIGEIGVDAGLAGFFDRKPDFDDNEWDEICDWMSGEYTHNPNNVRESYIDNFDNKDGFWTESGCGDGCYSVHAIRNNKRQIVALEIRF